MKRDDMDIDEILKHHLPRARQEDVDADLEAVRKRILKMRFEPQPDPVALAKKTPDAARLLDYQLGILMAVDELQGYGHPVSITLRAEEILEETMWGTAVVANLMILERMGLMSHLPIDPEKPKQFDRWYFAITDLGRETLAQALALKQRAAKKAENPLKGFV